MLTQIVQRWLEQRRLKRQINEEIAFHLEQAVDEEIARGLSPADARREARRRFGSARAVRGLCLEFANHGEPKPDRPRAPLAAMMGAAVATPLVLAVFLLLILVVHEWRSGRWVGLRTGLAAAGVFAVLAFAGVSVQGVNTKVMVYEYSAINRMFANHLPRWSWERKSDVGLSETTSEDFAFHPPGR